MAVPVDTLTPDAVVFDMDGVVIDSTSGIEDAWREAAHRYGRQLTDDDLRRYVHGQPGLYTVRSLFPDRDEEQQREIWRCVDEIQEISSCDPIPGVLPLLRQLHAAEVPLALVTSSWPARIAYVLRQLDLEDVFTLVIDRTQIPRGKPYPDPYLMAADRLGTGPGGILVFEDSDSGIASALDAGALCVAVGRADAGRPGAVAAIPDFTNLTLDRGDPARLVLAGLARHVVLGTRNGRVRA